MEIPEEIKQVRTFFENAESETDPTRKIYFLNEAVDLIEYYIDDYREEEIFKVIVRLDLKML